MAVWVNENSTPFKRVRLGADNTLEYMKIYCGEQADISLTPRVRHLNAAFVTAELIRLRAAHAQYAEVWECLSGSLDVNPTRSHWSQEEHLHEQWTGWLGGK